MNSTLDTGTACDSPTEEALEGLLNTYIERTARDKDRLEEMMHYAETVNCGTQIIRCYFGEEEGQPCLRCDNCAKAQGVERLPGASRVDQTQIGLRREPLHPHRREELRCAI